MLLDLAANLGLSCEVNEAGILSAAIVATYDTKQLRADAREAAYPLLSSGCGFEPNLSEV